MAPRAGGFEERTGPQGRLWASPTPFFLYIFSVLIKLSLSESIWTDYSCFPLNCNLVYGLQPTHKSLRSLSLEPLAKMTFDLASLPPWKSVTGQPSEKSLLFIYFFFVVYPFLVGNGVRAQWEERCYADQPGLGSHPGSTYHVGGSKLFNSQASVFSRVKGRN